MTFCEAEFASELFKSGSAESGQESAEKTEWMCCICICQSWLIVKAYLKKIFKLVFVILNLNAEDATVTFFKFMN